MPFFVVGLNHHSAPVAVREQLAVAAPEVPAMLRALVAAGVGVREAALLSTCNRTECYVATDDPQALIAWWLRQCAADEAQVRPHLFVRPELEGVRHAFRVASGLDSMVLGETQIVGQFKEAMRLAEEAGTLGTHVGAVMRQALSVAKEVRTNTQIGANVISMAAAAVRLSERVFGPVAQQNVLFVGAGEMIEVCAAHFAGQRPRRLAIVNRTLPRAQALAARFGGEAHPLAQLPDLLPAFDTVVASTASPLPIIGLGMVERALTRRRHRPMVMVDLAVPRDVEPEVGALDDVFLYAVDDLAAIVREGMASRQQAVAEAERIVAARLEEFAAWVRAREMAPLIRRLRQKAEAIAAAERERALARLRAGADPQAVVEALVHALTNKWLHAPSAALREAPPEAHAELLRWVPKLFALDHDDIAQNQS